MKGCFAVRHASGVWETILAELQRAAVLARQVELVAGRKTLRATP
jgi:hypothetical protein